MLEIESFFILIEKKYKCETLFSIEAERWRLSGKEVFTKYKDGTIVSSKKGHEGS